MVGLFKLTGWLSHRTSFFIIGTTYKLIPFLIAKVQSSRNTLCVFVVKSVLLNRQMVVSD